MVKVHVYVTLKSGVLDPQGSAVKNSLHTLGYNEVQEVKVGKFMELTVENGENLEERVKEMCEKLLSNPVIEDYSFEIEEVVSS
ncbi:phosphoribosylformylglycinamidine synthase subunit PurS [Thalassorhabdus alkalitolerans]|uniref:Phosphoribosylformylglycinamidine synthase subunit PurS n=1 Tax=Thalassorhabdus alkalitolerans TaxID=2282697 RepID=A0ABW0YR50_9BACI|nr:MULTISPECIES: phosphoribosylformylglycinamidine synthase subunit PurS [Bacillaceae]